MRITSKSVENEKKQNNGHFRYKRHNRQKAQFPQNKQNAKNEKNVQKKFFGICNLCRNEMEVQWYSSFKGRWVPYDDILDQFPKRILCSGCARYTSPSLSPSPSLKDWKPSVECLDKNGNPLPNALIIQVCFLPHCYPGWYLAENNWKGEIVDVIQIADAKIIKFIPDRGCEYDADLFLDELGYVFTHMPPWYCIPVPEEKFPVRVRFERYYDQFEFGRTRIIVEKEEKQKKIETGNMLKREIGNGFPIADDLELAEKEYEKKNVRTRTTRSRTNRSRTV